jgi:hypothetical protein
LRGVGRLRRKRITKGRYIGSREKFSEFDTWKHLALVLLGQ